MEDAVFHRQLQELNVRLSNYKSLFVSLTGTRNAIWLYLNNLIVEVVLAGLTKSDNVN